MNLPNISFIKPGVHVNTDKISALAVPVGAIVVSLLVFVLVVWPKFTSTLSLRSENKELELRVQKLIAKVDLLSSYDKVELQQNLGYAEALLPSDKGTFSLIRSVELAAASSGVVLTKVDVAPGSIGASSTPSSGQTSAPTAPVQAGSEPSDVSKILVRVSLSSDYNSILNFLKNIANNARIISIEDLTLSSSSAQGEASPLRTSMVINGYWKARPSKLGQIESPVTPLTDAESSMLAKVKTLISSSSSTSSDSGFVPEVPVGRSDLFAPF
ncbi:MAG: type 4a pilus biogenesis protein PilO [Candidatus Curtissbacteria bacterium]|nr:type 4a pilus biogenesis protein PilO [Candidatus Curtissbacteria bacterium]